MDKTSKVTDGGECVENFGGKFGKNLFRLKRSDGSERACDKVSVSYGTSTLRYKERKKKEEEKVSIDRVKLFIVINYRSLSAAGSSASRKS